MFSMNKSNQEGQTMSSEQSQYQQPQHPPHGEQGYVPPVGGHPYPAGQAINDRPRKSPVLATILSFFPGLGQVYVGYYQTGFIFVLTIAGCIALLSSSAGRGIEPFVGVFLSFFWIFNMIDANRRAQHYNLRKSGADGETIPDDFPTAGGKGSVPVGVILVVVGVAFILDLNSWMSLSWLREWWPGALVGAGAWMILKGRNQDS